MSDIANIWNYVLGPVVFIIIGAIINIIIEKRKALIQKDLKIVECSKIVGEQRMKNKDLFGPMAERIRINIPKAGPSSDHVEVNDLYFAKFCIRNKGNEPIQDYLIGVSEKPSSIWFTLREGGEQQNPDWERLLKERIQKEKGVSDEVDFYPIPYINPYSSGHEIILEIASYLPLDNMKIRGGAKSIKFVYKDDSNMNFITKMIRLFWKR